jgi:adenylosuccinate lyase
VQAAAMESWDSGTPFRENLHKQAVSRGQPISQEILDFVFRPERYTARLAPVFERLATLS